MKTQTFIAAGILTLFVGAAHAINDAGCGVGSMLFSDNTKSMQILAGTTNATTGTQLFGITSGTSNCKAQNIVMQEKTLQYFVEVNRDELGREMALGEGEKLAVLASLHGCEGPASRLFTKKVRANFGRLLPSPDTSATELLKNLHDLRHELASDPELAGTCVIL